jgi:hypothetical protein
MDTGQQGGAVGARNREEVVKVRWIWLTTSSTLLREVERGGRDCEELRAAQLDWIGMNPLMMTWSILKHRGDYFFEICCE